MNNVLLLFVAIIFVCHGDTANAFTCHEHGVFANTDFNDCKTFVTCDSDMVSTVRDCHDNTYFWPEKKGCFSNYNCATISMPDNRNPCEGSTYYGYENVPDTQSANCSRYLTYGSTTFYLNGESVLVPQVYSNECYSGSAFRPDYRSCVTGFQCTDYPCTAEGIFEDPNVNDCSTFVTCKSYATFGGSFFYATLNTCPADTKFSPILSKCDGFYNCDNVDPHSGVDPCSDFNYANPFIPNPYDRDSTSYIECHYDSVTKSLSILKRECPADTFFTPLLGKCYNNYDPSETYSKDPCSSGVGRYNDYKSGQCENFIECRDDSTTTALYQPVYQKIYCPPGTRYSPETSQCSRQYVCPTFPVNYCYPQIPTTTTSTTTTSAAAA